MFLSSEKVLRTRGWCRPTCTRPSTRSPPWSVRRSFRAASFPPTPTSASTGTSVTFQVKRVSPKHGNFHLKIFLTFPTVWFPGIDLAFIENGFIYHTKYDTADRILTDSIQRAGTLTNTTASAAPPPPDSPRHHLPGAEMNASCSTPAPAVGVPLIWLLPWQKCGLGSRLASVFTSRPRSPPALVHLPPSFTSRSVGRLR